MSNLIKKSWTVSSPHVPTMFRWTWFAWGCQWMAIYLQHKTKRPRESVNWSKFYGWRHKHFSRQKWNFQYFGLIFVYRHSNLSSQKNTFDFGFKRCFLISFLTRKRFFFHFWMKERCLNFMLLYSKQAKCCLISNFLIVNFTYISCKINPLIHFVISRSFSCKLYTNAVRATRILHTIICSEWESPMV